MLPAAQTRVMPALRAAAMASRNVWFSVDELRLRFATRMRWSMHQLRPSIRPDSLPEPFSSRTFTE